MTPHTGGQKKADEVTNSRLRWIFLMAWRDSRRSRTRLLLAASCIMVGISGLVATTSFRANVEHALNLQARTLLGADLAVRSGRPFSDDTNSLLGTLPGQQSRQISFISMGYFPGTGGTRLVRVRALEGGFPYYGTLETTPVNASRAFRSGASALVDDALMIQFDARVGDSIKLGNATFKIVGRLKKIPGETPVQSFIGPRVYIPYSQLPATGLLQRGSRTRHLRFFKFDDGVDVETLKRDLEARIEEPGIRIETVETRKQSLGKALTHVARFLNLVGFIAVLLGALAVASTMHIYIKQKIPTVGLLRCLGASQNRVLVVYLVQGIVVAFAGALAGAVLGIGLQQVLPALLAEFLPTRVDFALNPEAIFEGASTGLATALLFASLPLLSTRSVTPLQVLSGRISIEKVNRRVIVPGTIAGICLIGFFALAHTPDWQQAASFTGALLVAVLALVSVAQGIIHSTRRVASAHFSYVWRQALANLHRPNNQTPVLLLSLGLGTFLLVTIYLCQQMLLGQVSTAERQSEGNFVLFDVQSDQVGPIERVLRSFGLEPKYETPIVPMRLSALNGTSIRDLSRPENKVPEAWALRHEYRATYRDHLIDTEKLVQGRWYPNAGDGTEPYPVSLEQRIARSLGVKIGDELLFDVQGVPIATRITSIREVAWQRLQPNFFLVFPRGVLEEAPQTHAMLTRVSSAELSAKLQKAVVTEFPNISMIDLRLVLGSVVSLLDRIGLAIRFLGSFSAFAGVFVLLGTITTSRHHRFRENLLLRTLGASRLQILEINALEYFFLGLVAAIAGLALSLASAWVLGYYLFDSRPVLDWTIVAAALSLVTTLTIVTGLLGSWGTLTQPPLELLRNE